MALAAEIWLYFGQYRLRIDETRVFYEVSASVVEVPAIVPKSRAAEWLVRAGE